VTNKSFSKLHKPGFNGIKHMENEKGKKPILLPSGPILFPLNS
jgi:hypothetical protein